VYGRVETTDYRGPGGANATGRHRSRRPVPTPVMLGLIVAALLAAFALIAALVPSSLTGPGAEAPAAKVGGLAPGAGGGAPGVRAPRWADPSASRSPSASPSPARVARLKPRTSTTPRPRTRTRPSSGSAAQEAEIIRLVNVERRRAGCRSLGGENVARGQRDAADVMGSWMNSAGHRANILNCGFTAIGVGVKRGVDGTLVWGQLFGRF
jgi:Cysteine-rich secretory protein family